MTLPCSYARFFALGLLGLLPACGGDSPAGEGSGGGSSGTSSTGTSSTGSASTGSAAQGGGGSGPAACSSSLAPESGDALHLAIPARLSPGEEKTLCLRHTLTEALDVTALTGTLGPGGHHNLLLAHLEPTAPDGLAPCSQPEIMDAASLGEFHMLAGTSYESDGVRYAFPKAPVQVGLHVPAGAQLVLVAHLVNPTAEERDACTTIDLERGAPVVAKLRFRTVLPEAQYGLVVPPAQEIEVAYEEPAGERFRVAAASTHMHEGGKHIRLSVVETDQTLHESSDWADPTPAIYDTQKVVVEADQTLRVECTLQNTGSAAQAFPDQMCVGGMYVLSCGLPGAC